MKIVRFQDVPQIPVSHEDPNDPGVVKKVLLTVQDHIAGTIQMINWATVLPGRSVSAHTHRDMTEIYVMLADGATATVAGEAVSVSRGDLFIVAPGETHALTNSTKNPIEFLVFGIA